MNPYVITYMDKHGVPMTGHAVPEPIMPFDTWARSHNLIPVGSQLVFTASKDGETRIFFVDMAIPTIIPNGMAPETFMRSTWLASVEAERERCRADGWTC